MKHGGVNFKGVIKGAFYSLIAILIIVPALMTRATEGLLNVSGIISTMVPLTDSEHRIAFTLPINSEPITKTDYIIIDFEKYSSVYVPGYLSGSFESDPDYRIDGKKVKITGVEFMPSARVIINGIKTNNPLSTEDFDYTITIANDWDGNLARNFAVVSPYPVETDNIEVSANVDAPTGSLQINGFAPPEMFLMFTEDETVIGTTVADENGMFSQVFLGLSPQVHNIAVFGTDSNNLITPSVIVEIYTPVYRLTTIGDIIISPTVDVSSTEIVQGDPVTISGRGIPGYRVNIFTEPPLNNYETLVDGSGNFSLLIESTANMNIGQQKVIALHQNLNSGAQSLLSNPVFFKVIKDDDPDDPPPGCQINRGDLNCDETVNLTDFSILLYYWGSTAARADINNDNIIDIVDFSIMMFYWNG